MAYTIIQESDPYSRIPVSLSIPFLHVNAVFITKTGNIFCGNCLEYNKDATHEKKQTIWHWFVDLLLQIYGSMKPVYHRFRKSQTSIPCVYAFDYLPGFPGYFFLSLQYISFSSQSRSCCIKLFGLRKYLGGLCHGSFFFNA